jgi:hypothetical protein
MLEKTSVPDQDPHVFGPPGSGSISQRYGSGSGSFYHQANIVRKTLIPTVLSLILDFLSFKNDVNIPLKSNKAEILPESGSISQRHGSADPDPHQNVKDPEHWKKLFLQRITLNIISVFS